MEYGPCPGRCDISQATYPEHVLYATKENPLLLGSKHDFCEGIFHVFPAPEFHIMHHGSLTGEIHDNCRVRAMTMIAICGNLIARFTNCNRKHAEEFLVRDRKMFMHVRTFKPKAMILFMKHHPCHHSSGNAKRYPDGYFVDKKSCAEQIIRYYNEVLRPNGTNLVIKVAWLYKAFWQHSVRDDDKQAVANSLLGLEMMLEAGIRFKPMSPPDWIRLANLCEDPIPLSILLSRSRLTVDYCLSGFITNVETRLRKQQDEANQKALDEKQLKNKVQQEPEEVEQKKQEEDEAEEEPSVKKIKV